MITVLHSGDTSAENNLEAGNNRARRQENFCHNAEQGTTSLYFIVLICATASHGGTTLGQSKVSFGVPTLAPAGCVERRGSISVLAFFLRVEVFKPPQVSI